LTPPFNSKNNRNGEIIHLARKETHMKYHPCVVLAVLLALGVLPIQGQDITGTWKADFETAIGHLKYTYQLKNDGTNLTGKALRDLDGEKTDTQIVEGQVKGDDVSFVEPLKFQDQDIRIEYKGKLAGDEIKFTRKVADFATTEIVAKREKSGAASPAGQGASSAAGKWQAEFDTQIGKQKYTYDLHVDGDKLTGRAIGDIAGEKSDTEIAQGKVNGSELSFVETVKYQGQDVRIDYKGKLAGDEIKFTRQVGDVATEEMVAKRVKEAAPK
jgi:FKBP-type peptidyl-prolyl cis-trans isomerase 2